jgi:hypothetical protein
LAGRRGGGGGKLPDARAARALPRVVESGSPGCPPHEPHSTAEKASNISLEVWSSLPASVWWALPPLIRPPATFSPLRGEGTRREFVRCFTRISACKSRKRGSRGSIPVEGRGKPSPVVLMCSEHFNRSEDEMRPIAPDAGKGVCVRAEHRRGMQALLF